MNKPAFTVGLLVYSHCLPSQLFGLRDSLQVANRVAELEKLPPLDIKLIGLQDSVQSVNGEWQIRCSTQTDDIDVLLVPGFFLRRRAELPKIINALHDEIHLLKHFAASGRLLASCCVGSFLLAEAGVLDKKHATTAWYFADQLRQHSPTCLVDNQAMLITDGNITTSGAMLSWVDLIITLISRFYSQDISRLCRQLLLADAPRTSQAAFMNLSLTRIRRGHFAEQVEALLDANLASPYDLNQMAAALQTSTRTLLRKYNQLRGISPLKYLQNRRMEQARQLLETSTLSIEQIAQQVGYQDLSAFRAVFNREAGMPPASYRRMVSRSG